MAALQTPQSCAEYGLVINSNPCRDKDMRHIREKSALASAFHDLPVSIATGMKMWVLVVPVYFVFLVVVALSAAAPA